MPEDQMTVSEVYRVAKSIQASVDRLTEGLEQRPDWTDLKRSEDAIYTRINTEETVRKLERVAADKAIKALEDWNAWAVRLLLGGAATGILGWVATRALG